MQIYKVIKKEEKLSLNINGDFTYEGERELEGEVYFRHRNDAFDCAKAVTDKTYQKRGSYFFRKIGEVIEVNVVVSETKAQSPELLPIAQILSVRAANALKRNGIRYLGELQKCTLEQIRRMRCIGPACMSDIQDAMNFYGLKFKEEE